MTLNARLLVWSGSEESAGDEDVASNLHKPKT